MLKTNLRARMCVCSCDLALAALLAWIRSLAPARSTLASLSPFTPRAQVLSTASTQHGALASQLNAETERREYLSSVAATQHGHMRVPERSQRGEGGGGRQSLEIPQHTLTGKHAARFTCPSSHSSVHGCRRLRAHASEWVCVGVRNCFARTWRTRGMRACEYLCGGSYAGACACICSRALGNKPECMHSCMHVLAACAAVPDAEGHRFARCEFLRISELSALDARILKTVLPPHAMHGDIHTSNLVSRAHRPRWASLSARSLLGRKTYPRRSRCSRRSTRWSTRQWSPCSRLKRRLHGWRIWTRLSCGVRRSRMSSTVRTSVSSQTHGSCCSQHFRKIAQLLQAAPVLPHP
eukprot:1457759-Pleurochrysis_carterae.AAC.1